MYQASAAVAVFRDKPNFSPDPSSLFSLLFWGGIARRSLQGFIALIVRHIGRDELMRQQGGGFKWGGEGIFVLLRRGTGVATISFFISPCRSHYWEGYSSPLPQFPVCVINCGCPLTLLIVSPYCTHVATPDTYGGNGCLLFPRRPTCCFLRRLLPRD